MGFWGPQFPDQRSSLFPRLPAPASLALADPVTTGTAFQTASLRARAAGTDGNLITAQFEASALTAAGEFVENVGLKTTLVKFLPSTEAPAVQASLDPSTLVTGNAWDHTVLRARVPGAAGNAITVAFVPTGTGYHLIEDLVAMTVVVNHESVTAQQIVDLFNDESLLIEAVVDGGFVDVPLVPPDDDFAATNLAGGADASGAPGSTAGDVAALLATSSLVELAGFLDPSVQAQDPGDEFGPTNLTGGRDADFSRVRFWGPYFPEDDDLVHYGATGPYTAGTFALVLESGFSVRFSWDTNIIKVYSGLETQRINKRDYPVQTYEGAAYLIGTDVLSVRTQLQRLAALGQPFLIGLPYEELTIRADSTGTVVPVWSTALADWALVGQRVIVMGASGFVIGVIQAVTSDSITLDVEPGLVGARNCRIMPGMPVLLEPQQGFSRFARPESLDYRIEEWQIRGRAAMPTFIEAAISAQLVLFGITSGDSQGIYFRSLLAGAAGNDITVQFTDDSISGVDLEEDVTAKTVHVKFTVGVTVQDVVDAINATSELVEAFIDEDVLADPESPLVSGDDEFGPVNLEGGSDSGPGEVGRGATVATFDGRPIFDRGVMREGSTVQESIQSMHAVVDLGGIPFGAQVAERADWGRIVAAQSSDRADWQWFKRFLHTVRGSQRAFYLPTFRDDLQSFYDGPGGAGTTGTIRIDGFFGDFFAWYPVYDIIAIVQGDDYTIARITGYSYSSTDIILTIELDPTDPGATLPAAAPIDQIMWLQLCRFENDASMSVRWKAGTFTFAEQARVVTQPIEVRLHGRAALTLDNMSVQATLLLTYTPTVAATLDTDDLTPLPMFTDSTPWTAVVTWQQLGVVGNGKTLDLRFDVGSSGVEVRDGERFDFLLSDWITDSGCVGVRIRSDIGDPITIGAVESAINAGSALIQVTTPDISPSKEVDVGLLDASNINGTFSGGV